MEDAGLNKKIQIFKYGFSLYENLAVFVLMIILVSLGMVAYNRILTKSETTVCQANLHILNDAARRYEIEHDHYPDSIEQLYEYGYLDELLGSTLDAAHLCPADGYFYIMGTGGNDPRIVCSVHSFNGADTVQYLAATDQSAERN